jgi:exopolyphosphatase
LPTRLRASRLVLVLGFLSLPLLLAAIALTAYIRPALLGLGKGASSHSYCVPFNLHRISGAAHYRYSCYSNSTSTSTHSTHTHTMSTSNASSETHDASGPGAGAGKAYPQLGRLAGFLQAQKDAFVGDLRAGNGKGWVVVMGNDAGGE